MGRPYESPWSVRWASFSGAPALFHGDDRFVTCNPARMMAVLQSLGRLSSDVSHLIRWAAWVDAYVFEPDATPFLSDVMVSIADQPGWWKSLPFSRVAHLDPPSALNLLNTGVSKEFIEWCPEAAAPSTPGLGHQLTRRGFSQGPV